MWRRNNQRGHTLAELMVSLSLGLMVCAGTVSLTGWGIRLYRQISADADLIWASDQIFSQIAALADRAGPGCRMEILREEEGREGVVFDGPYETIWIRCLDEGNGLAVGLSLEDGGEEWTISSGGGTAIRSLTFSCLEDSAVLEIDLALIHKETGFTYQAFRWIRP